MSIIMHMYISIYTGHIVSSLSLQMSWHLTVPSHQQAQCWLHYQNRIIFKVSLSIRYFYVHVNVHQHMKLHINLSTSPYKRTLNVKYHFLPILPPNSSSLPPCIYHQYKYPPVNTYNPYIDWSAHLRTPHNTLQLISESQEIALCCVYLHGILMVLTVWNLNTSPTIFFSGNIDTLAEVLFSWKPKDQSKFVYPTYLILWLLLTWCCSSATMVLT